jgi:Fungal Zn(2)-Cys(6) binuclear cluster domain
MSSSLPTKNKYATSCVACRNQHVKCVGGSPCQRCTHLELQCEILERPNSLTYQQLKAEKCRLENKYSQVMAENAGLNQQNVALKEQNEILKTDIASLKPQLDKPNFKDYISKATMPPDIAGADVVFIIETVKAGYFRVTMEPFFFAEFDDFAVRILIDWYFKHLTKYCNIVDQKSLVNATRDFTSSVELKDINQAVALLVMWRVMLITKRTSSGVSDDIENILHVGIEALLSGGRIFAETLANDIRHCQMFSGSVEGRESDIISIIQAYAIVYVGLYNDDYTNASIALHRAMEFCLLMNIHKESTYNLGSDRLVCKRLWQFVSMCCAVEGLSLINTLV